MRSVLRIACAGVIGAAVGCDKQDDFVFDRFNSKVDASVFVEVGVEELGPEVSTPLWSAVNPPGPDSDGIQIGLASINPTAGPLGTEHRIMVQVTDWLDPCSTGTIPDTEAGGPCVTEPVHEIVDRVSVRVDSGDHGFQLYELVQDAASIEFWGKTLISDGPPGEVRTDTLEFILWEGRRAANGEE